MHESEPGAATLSRNAGLPCSADGRDAPARRLTHDLDCDICIIGGGFAGLWAAHALREQGHDVVVLEQGRLGEGASGRNAGCVGPGYPLPLDRLVKRVGLEHARALWSLSDKGAEIVRKLAHEARIAMSGGWLQVSGLDNEAGSRRRADSISRRLGTTCEAWSTTAVRDVVRSDRYHQAIHFPDAFHLDPAALLKALAERLRGAGVHIFEETEATQADVSGLRKQIATPNARVRAHHVVFAYGVPTASRLSPATGSLLPITSFLGLTEPLGNRLGVALQYAGTVSEAQCPENQFHQIGDRLLWASGATVNFGTTRGLRERMSREIGSVFPALNNVRIEHACPGTTACAVHEMPQIGQLHPGVWIIAALGRQGLAVSAMAGKLVASGIERGDDRWKLFAPFGVVSALGAMGRMGAEIRLRAASLRRQ